MGSAVARTLLAAGHTMLVGNRTLSKLAPLVERSARPVGSVHDAIVQSDAAIVMVSDYAANDAMLRTATAEAALRDKTLAELTSGTPAEARPRAFVELPQSLRQHRGLGVRAPDRAVPVLSGNGAPDPKAGHVRGSGA